MTVEQINDDEFNQKVLEGSKDKPVSVSYTHLTLPTKRSV